VRGGSTLYVKHLESMSAFYQKCFGLTAVEEAPGDYAILESDSWSLSIVAVSDRRADAMQISDPPARREKTPIKLAFDVPSIDRLRSTMPLLAGRVDPVERQWQFRGFRHCDCIDPEGNVVQLKERLVDDG
jgi:predicted enzyme related to lactoylglutathione lyase